MSFQGNVPSSASTLRLGIGGAWAVAAASAALLSTFLVLTGLLLDNARVTYVGMAQLAFLIPASVGLIRGRAFDIFEPINLVALSILFGTTLRAFYLVASDSSQVEFLMMGTTFEAVNLNLPWILLGIASLSLGYVLCTFRAPLERLRVVREYVVGRTRFWFSVGLATTVGLIGLILFIRQYNIDLTGNLLAQSTKKMLTIEGEEGVVYGVGYAPFLAGMLQYGPILVGTALIARLLQPKGSVLAIFGFLFLLACVMPFFASSRSSIVIMIVMLCIAGYYYGRIKVRTLVIALTVITVVITAMGAVRAVNARQVNDRSTLDRTIGSGHGLDVVRTSAIMDRVPELRPHQNGLTYISLFTAPIPRTYWPQKPPVGLGPWVKSELFGLWSRKGGWPPGIIGEAYINFGAAGIAFVMFAFGGLLRFMYESSRPFLGASFLITVVYCRIVWDVAFTMAGLDFSLAMLNAIRYSLPLLIFALLARLPYRRIARQRVAPV